MSSRADLLVSTCLAHVCFSAAPSPEGTGCSYRLTGSPSQRLPLSGHTAHTVTGWLLALGDLWPSLWSCAFLWILLETTALRCDGACEGLGAREGLGLSGGTAESCWLEGVGSAGTHVQCVCYIVSACTCVCLVCHVCFVCLYVDVHIRCTRAFAHYSCVCVACVLCTYVWHVLCMYAPAHTPLLCGSWRDSTAA